MRFILNGPHISNPHNIATGPELAIVTGPITRQSIIKAIAKIKNGKAPGPDKIPPEAMKASSEVTADIMSELIRYIWDSEKVPEEWRVGYIVKLPKKGDPSECQNWRGIQLLSMPSKVMTRIILERIKAEVDRLLREEQTGFRRGRPCSDQKATLRIIF